MTSTSEAVNEIVVAESLNNLQSSTPQTAIHDLTPPANPWEDGAEKPPQVELPIVHPSVDPIFALDNIKDQPFEPNAQVELGHQGVLGQFDPLRNRDEQAAKDAWERSESHPPPALAPQSLQQDTSVFPPSSTGSDAPSNLRPSTPSFPGFAAIARSFSLPRGRINRPESVDTAIKITSPTISTFAKQLPHSRSQSQQPPNSDRHSNSISVSVSSPSIQVIKGDHDDHDQLVPFDFQKFLDQMKSKSAEPVAKYLRSFLTNFSKRTFTVTDQVKLIQDFLNFIAARMRENDTWRYANEAEFDNALEGMEKLVMNRLYEHTFSPQVARLVPPRPLTSDDLERDRVLSQRAVLFSWIEEKHLDVPEEDGSKGFLMFAQQELLKVNHYKAPRDKLICILNCCKVIFGMLRHIHREEGADAFLPILIFVVLKANPEHLLSNVEFIARFRSPAKLQSEAGYYLSSLMGALSFIETMDHTALSNITQEEFGRNVEEAIQSLPSAPHSPAAISPGSTPPRSRPESRPATPISSMRVGEESAEPLAMPTPGPTLGEDARRLLQKTGDTISKPLNALGRIFSEALDNAEDQLKAFPGPFGDTVREERPSSAGGISPQTPLGVGEGGQQLGLYQPPIQPPYKPRVRRMASSSTTQLPSPDTPSRTYAYSDRPLLGGTAPQEVLPTPRVQSLINSEDPSRNPSPRLDYPRLQAEIDQAHEQRSLAAKETLKQIFPGTDVEVVQWVLEANENDLGKSIEQLLEMS